MKAKRRWHCWVPHFEHLSRILSRKIATNLNCKEKTIKNQDRMTRRKRKMGRKDLLRVDPQSHHIK